MSLPETKDWKVLDFRPGKTEPNPHGGEFQKFYVDFEGSDDTYWRRNAGDAPEKGKTYFGTVSEGNYGPMFKKEKKPDGYSGSSESSTGRSASTDYQRSKSPEDQAEIRRLHSQEMAIRWAAKYAISPDGSLNLDELFKLADFFDQDAIAAGRKAVSGDEASKHEAPVDLSGARTEEPIPPKPSVNFHRDELPDSAQDLDDYRQLLWNAGLEPAAARDKVTEYMGVVLPKDRLDKAVSGLQDLDRQGTVLAQLKTETEKWIKGPLPQGDALDGEEEIPF